MPGTIAAFAAHPLIANEAKAYASSCKCAQRIEAGEVSLKHCPDASMPADFLTKWLGMPKVNKSIRYCTNARNAVRPESATNGNPQLSRSAEPGAPAGGGVSRGSPSASFAHYKYRNSV